MTQAPLSHDEAMALLDAYLDGELDVVSSMAFDRHAADCPHCQTRLEQRRRLSAQIQSAPLRWALPPELDAAVIERAVGAPQSPGRQRVSGTGPARWPYALAAGLLLTLSGYFVGQSVQRPADLGDALVDAHIRSVLNAHGVDVVSSDHHTVKPWLSARLPFSPPVPELASQGDSLLGGRVDYLNQHQIAALVYQHGKHQVNVFVWPTSAMPAFSTRQVSSEGYHLMTTHVGGFTAAIVSDLSADELAGFRDRWREATGL